MSTTIHDPRDPEVADPYARASAPPAPKVQPLRAKAIPLPIVSLCANGLPAGHLHALDAAVQELRDLVNSLPESVYHLGPDDARWLMDCAFARYWHTLTKR